MWWPAVLATNKRLLLAGLAALVTGAWLLTGHASPAGAAGLVETRPPPCAAVRAPGPAGVARAPARSSDDLVLASDVLFLVEGTLKLGAECWFLSTPFDEYVLVAMPSGFNPGDFVSVVGKVCPAPCVTICLAGSVVLEVVQITLLSPAPTATPTPTITPTATSTPGPVGGIARPPGAAPPASGAGDSRWLAVTSLAVAAGMLALGGVWLARQARR